MKIKQKKTKTTIWNFMDLWSIAVRFSKWIIFFSLNFFPTKKTKLNNKKNKYERWNYTKLSLFLAINNVYLHKIQASHKARITPLNWSSAKLLWIRMNIHYLSRKASVNLHTYINQKCHYIVVMKENKNYILTKYGINISKYTQIHIMHYVRGNNSDNGSAHQMKINEW